MPDLLQQKVSEGVSGETSSQRVSPDSFRLSAFIGLPYAFGGRGPEAFDCWGLVLAVAKSAGFDYPEYPVNPSDCRAVAGAMQTACADSTTWLRLTHPEPWCVVLLTTASHGDHVGIALPSLSVPSVPSVSSVFLQTSRKTGSILCRFNDPRHSIKGLYRWTGRK